MRLNGTSCTDPNSVRGRLKRADEIFGHKNTKSIYIKCGPFAVSGSSRMQSSTSEQLIISFALELALGELARDTVSLKERKEELIHGFGECIELLCRNETVKIMADAVDKECELYSHGGHVTYFADEYLMKNNAAGKRTVMIVPVGPTAQYPILARLVNQLRVSLKDVWFFNMDEYLITPDRAIDPNDPMSFHKRMNDEFYSRVDAELIMPEGQRLFPEPGKEAEYDALIEALGGVDLCLGGLGINGHVAFNEPPEAGDNISADEYAALGTRVLPISRETMTINAYGYQRGDLRGMPMYCITVGMKQIIAARRIYIALNRDWQHGIVKHVLFDDPTPSIPTTLLKRNGNFTVVAYDSVANGLFN